MNQASGTNTARFHLNQMAARIKWSTTLAIAVTDTHTIVIETEVSHFQRGCTHMCSADVATGIEGTPTDSAR